MPNLCSYLLKVKGSKENCEKFHAIMEDYDLPKHFWRVFEADIFNEEETEDGYVMEIGGSCAWSVRSCMCKGVFTYANEHPDNGTSLLEQSLELGLEIEVYSEECGVGFMEHYHYKNGEELENECEDYTTFWWDRDEHSTFEEFCKEYNLSGITENDLNDNDEYCVGGFEWVFSF